MARDTIGGLAEAAGVFGGKNSKEYVGPVATISAIRMLTERSCAPALGAP